MDKLDQSWVRSLYRRRPCLPLNQYESILNYCTCDAPSSILELLLDRSRFGEFTRRSDWTELCS